MIINILESMITIFEIKRVFTFFLGLLRYRFWLILFQSHLDDDQKNNDGNEHQHTDSHLGSDTQLIIVFLFPGFTRGIWIKKAKMSGPVFSYKLR